MVDDGNAYTQALPSILIWANPADVIVQVIAPNGWTASVENDDLILSDSFLDMNAGTKTVKVLSGDMNDLKVKSVYDIR